MALNANALTTVARLAEFMGIDTPAANSAAERKLESQINAISNFIQRYTGVTFKRTTYTNEEYTVERGQSFNLKHFPVDTSQPFVIARRNSGLNEDDWVTVDGQYYDLDAEAGIVFTAGTTMFVRGRDNYRVTYTAGFDFDNSATFLSDTDGGDVELAVWLMGQDFYNTGGNNSNIKSEKIGDYSVTYGGTNGMMLANQQALSILDYWRDLRGDGVLTPPQ